MKLSACVMTKNSMRTLPACLASLEPFCDEVVVVDDESTDGTWEFLEVRQREGKVRPLRRRLDTFAAHRKWMCTQAKGEWLLIVDADEEALPGLGDEVRALLATNPTRDAFHVPQKNMLPSHWPKPVWFWTSQKRLLRTRSVAWPVSEWVHVPVIHKGRAGRLRHGLKHHSYDSVMHLLKKQLYYAQSGAKHGANRESVGFTRIAVKTTYAFLKYFIVKGLFRFGVSGLIVSLALSFHAFAKYALLWEEHLGVQPIERGEVPGERNH